MAKESQQIDLIEKFEKKKVNNINVIEKIEKHLSIKGFERIITCSNYLTLLSNREFSKKKVYKANYCHNRFCLICAYIKAKKDAYMLDTVMKFINQVEEKEFIFLTLTMPNAFNDEVEEQIKLFQDSFRKFIKYKEIERINQGYCRKLEITYNKEQNTYNVHYHVIMAVNKSYFSGNGNYLKRNKFLSLWKSATNNPNITQVDVRRIKKNNDKSNTALEIAKYVAKDTDYITQEVFDIIYTALKGKQIITYNGLFKEAINLYKKKDEKIKPFLFQDDTVYEYLISYEFNETQKYKKTIERLLNQDEKKRLNFKLLEDKKGEY